MSGTPPLSPSQVPVGVDPARPSIARIYDGFLGGKNVYDVDRAVMEKINAVAPEAVDIARANRRFLGRACRFLATQTAIEQYIDCGSGLPTSENTHQIVQRTRPDATVVYVDNDPVVLAHGRALLEENDFVHMVEADVFQSQTVLTDPTIQRHVDFSQPLVLLHVATLHHLEGQHAPEVMRQYVDALPSGSYVVFSHFLDPENEATQVAKKIEQVMLSGPLGAGRFRSTAELAEILSGLEIIQPNATTGPGIVACDAWWPDGPRLAPASLAAQCIAGAVARKP
ncbi:SAM-dependent methyltransferase [Kutzneria sp. CA-103260]|uniref:SAM-dependent methyltransferase n=1 Tax=Kutzneria sp. CA-103260 TaxID=2802641 RepID=UPI001BA610A9|nr:SAM-dependent methyltransferase [Kutzneria sp. CA-103260]QUQ63305.1 SAM-dependent methyltransferase [Kutzneria sp. CA-103260]